MSKPRILLQLDSDPHASSFDAVVAVDAGVDQLLPYAPVASADVRGLVHGAIFTRGPKDLKHTAIFVGGSNVAVGEQLFQQVKESFFGPMRVSVMFDASGANTTAVAAVISAAGVIELNSTKAAVLGATGPVGQRAVHLLARAGAAVQVASRSLDRAGSVCEAVNERLPDAQLTARCSATPAETRELLDGVQIVIAAGAAGCELLPAEIWQELSSLKVAIDLNAVPPAGIAGIGPIDHGETRNGVACFGALGVGGLKMKIHKAAIRRLFESNDQMLDADEIFELGRELIANQ
jgi:hypothetical protein